MVETDILLRSALEGIAKPARYGRADGPAGVIAQEVAGFGLAGVAARAGRADALATAVRESYGLELPQRPSRIGNQRLTLICTGPDQWLAMTDSAPSQGMEALLGPAIGEHAAIVDQSHARVILRLSGPRVRDALAKGVPIDLHPRAFKPGDTASTILAHVGIQLWQIDAAPTYEIAAYRGYAGSVWNWLVASASEFGLEYGSTARCEHSP